jgi:hypothetical protein
MNNPLEQVEKIIGQYVEDVHSELGARWQRWHIDLAKPELHEVVAALLARQVTLATQLARSPATWNAHIAPVLLRSMTDAYITLAWMLKDPVERGRKFILYGLGQQKLMVEHRKAALSAEGKDPTQDPLIKAAEAWLNAQRFEFLTEVNVGSWSETPTREMAEQAECLDLYRYAYIPFSAATHNMWHHISRLNLEVCENPLHRFHKVPVDPDLSPDPDYLYRAAKYVEKSFSLFDATFSVESGVPSAFERLANNLASFDSSTSDLDKDPVGS